MDHKHMGRGIRSVVFQFPLEKLCVFSVLALQYLLLGGSPLGTYREIINRYSIFDIRINQSYFNVSHLSEQYFIVSCFVIYYTTYNLFCDLLFICYRAAARDLLMYFIQCVVLRE